MKKYYLLSWKDQQTQSPVAYAPQGSSLAYELINELEGKNELSFPLTIYKVSVGSNGLTKSPDLDELNYIWADYLANSFALPLVSEKMKRIIEENLGGRELIDWITVEVIADKEKRSYFMLRFKKLWDVLDKEKSMFVPNTESIINPAFSLSKLENINLFPLPQPNDLWKLTASIYVDDTLKKALTKEKLKNVGFESARAI